MHAGDSISLAEAGKKYLMRGGVPKDVIIADGSEANGTDEILKAFDSFEEHQCNQFHICCSENQVMRNKVACIELLGILPYFHTVTVLEEPMSHALGFELVNPNGALRFLNDDKGQSADAKAREKHTSGA